MRSLNLPLGRVMPWYLATHDAQPQQFSLFIQPRRIGVLGSSYTGRWISSSNTAARRRYRRDQGFTYPQAALLLDRYASSWISLARENGQKFALVNPLVNPAASLDNGA
jgi:hypothetical protein